MYWEKIIPSISIALSAAFGTYSDIARTKPQTNFNPSETVYLQISDLPGVIYLLDSQKNRIFEIENKQFLAPDSGGTYYIDAKLSDGQGKTFSGQRNINVLGKVLTNDPTLAPIVIQGKTIPDKTIKNSVFNIIFSIFKLLGIDKKLNY